MKKLIIAFVAILSILIGFGYRTYDHLTRPLPLPKLDPNVYWGPGSGVGYKPDTSIKPFQVKFSKEEVADLQSQLNRTYNLAEPLEGIGFEYGFNTNALEQYIEFWRDNYLPRWSEREKLLNSLPQFTTEIQGLRIHYIHSKPDAEKAKNTTTIPLLLLHGWPGSVREFYDFIPNLVEPGTINNYTFEVIAPSLVGYGFSQAASRPGFNAAQMAIVMRNLMLRLGHKKFLVQGGDWGSIIGSNLATIFPENVIGYHSNMCILRTPLATIKSIYGTYFPEKVLPSRFFHDHHFPLSEKIQFLIAESGYFHIQATKPDTVGTVQLQSPVGLATYILEKFQTATGMGNRFEAIQTAYGVDDVLDNIMIYYMTGTATSAARFYAENMSREYLNLQLERVQSPVPMACIRFLFDLPSVTDWQLQDKFPNLIHSKYIHNGGHFAALESTVILYLDFVEFVQKIYNPENK